MHATCTRVPDALHSIKCWQDLITAVYPQPLSLAASASAARNEARLYMRAWRDVAVSAASALIVIAEDVDAPCLAAAAGFLCVASRLHRSGLLPGTVPGSAGLRTGAAQALVPRSPFSGSFTPPSLVHMAQSWAHGTAAQLIAARQVAGTAALADACAGGDAKQAIGQLREFYSWAMVDIPVPRPAKTDVFVDIAPTLPLAQMGGVLRELKQQHTHPVHAGDRSQGFNTKQSRQDEASPSGARMPAVEAVWRTIGAPSTSHLHELSRSGHYAAAVAFGAACVDHLMISANNVLPSLPTAGHVPAPSMVWVHACVSAAATVGTCLDEAVPGAAVDKLDEPMLSQLQRTKAYIVGALAAWEFLLLQCVATGGDLPPEEASVMTLLQPKVLARTSGLQYIIRQFEGWDRSHHAVQQLFSLCVPSLLPAEQAGEYEFPATAAPTGTLYWCLQQCIVLYGLLDQQALCAPGPLGEQLVLLHLLFTRGTTAAGGMMQLLHHSQLHVSIYKLIPGSSRASIESRGVGAARGSKERQYGVTAPREAPPPASSISAKQRAKHNTALSDALDAHSHACMRAVQRSLAVVDAGLQRLGGVRTHGISQLLCGMLLCADSIVAALAPSDSTPQYLHGFLPLTWQGCLSSARLCRRRSTAATEQLQAFSLWQMWANTSACHASGDSGKWLSSWVRMQACSSAQPLVEAGLLPGGLHAALPPTQEEYAAHTTPTGSWLQFRAGIFNASQDIPPGATWLQWRDAWQHSALAPGSDDLKLAAMLAINAGHPAHAAVLLSLCEDAALLPAALAAAAVAVEEHMRQGAQADHERLGQILGQLAHEGVIESLLLHARSAGYERCTAQLAAGGEDVHGEAAADVRSAGLQLAAAVIRQVRAKQPIDDHSALCRHTLQVLLG